MTVSTYAGNIVVMRKSSMQTPPQHPKRQIKYSEYQEKIRKLGRERHSDITEIHGALSSDNCMEVNSAPSVQKKNPLIL